MIDVLHCYGIAASIIRAGYLGLVRDFFRQAWATCGQLGSAVADTARRPLQSGATRFRRASGISRRSRARLENYVTSMT